MCRGRAQAGGPVLPDQVVVGADAAGGDEDHRARQLELADSVRELRRPRAAVGASIAPAHAVDGPVGHGELVHPVPEAELTRPGDAAARTRRTNGATTPGRCPR